MILGNKGAFSHPISTLLYVQATAKHKEQSGQAWSAPSAPALKPRENHCQKFMIKELHPRLVTREPGNMVLCTDFCAPNVGVWTQNMGSSSRTPMDHTIPLGG